MHTQLHYGFILLIYVLGSGSVILPDKSFLSEKIIYTEREQIQRSLVFMKLERPQEEETCRMISEIQ